MVSEKVIRKRSLCPLEEMHWCASATYIWSGKSASSTLSSSHDLVLELGRGQRAAWRAFKGVRQRPSRSKKVKANPVPVPSFSNPLPFTPKHVRPHVSKASTRPLLCEDESRCRTLVRRNLREQQGCAESPIPRSEFRSTGFSCPAVLRFVLQLFRPGGSPRKSWFTNKWRLRFVQWNLSIVFKKEEKEEEHHSIHGNLEYLSGTLLKTIRNSYDPRSNFHLYCNKCWAEA